MGDARDAAHAQGGFDADAAERRKVQERVYPEALGACQAVFKEDAASEARNRVALEKKVLSCN